MGLFRKFFPNQKKERDSVPQSGEELSIEEFARLSADRRMLEAMYRGDSGDLKYYPLLKHCIWNDPNVDVKFSALKRIHLFKDEPDCKNMLIELGNQVNTKSLEPYYSMALSKTGIISPEEFKERIDRA